MIKVFVSLPWQHDKGDEYMKHLQRSLMYAYCEKEFIPVDNVILMDTIFHTGSALKSLGYSIGALADANVALFAPDWETARGCIVEELAARTYNIPCYYL